MTTFKQAVERACASIAPTWPLDRFIAVNPFWSRTNQPLPKVAGELAALSGAHLLMPRSWYAQQWREEHLRAEHLRAAIAQSGTDMTEDHLSALLRIEETTPPRRPLMVDVMDARWRRELEVSWRDYVVERVSRFCAVYFDDGGMTQSRPTWEKGFYASWRQQAQRDWGPVLFMGLSKYRSAVAALPTTAEEMLALVPPDLGVPEAESEHYLSALLLDVNGWASWCAYRRWTARLSNGDDNHIFELLAIRAAWEWILFRAGPQELRTEWRHTIASWPTFDLMARSARDDDWLLQRAVEIAWVEGLVRKLPEGFETPRPSAPTVQVAFCLDVRSEVFRRALESQNPAIQTLGCAGFFGLSIEYAPMSAGGAHPQLPGLMAPKYRATDTGVPETLVATRTSRLQASLAWKAFKSSALSSFAFVDAMGLFSGASLLQETFGRGPRDADHHGRVGLTEEEAKLRTPRITSHVDGTPITAEERCAIAEGLLRAMSLTRGFARLVLLIGHCAGSRNNPYAAGLDCGACGGQTGEVNARAAAALLNDMDVRARLAAHGIEIPNTTQFVPGVHNTTTDDLTLFDEATVPETHKQELADLRATFARAGIVTRRERAPKLGLVDLSDADLHAAVVERSKDWAQVRPEWGLVGNAAFIIAARERTRHLDLQGRSFLHDYRFEEDSDFALLEQIMSGPMVVTHWINFQYYASTADNTRYGTGNKLLHNVVGGHLGVFEGNGGDLRIGLSIQSLHDGERWMHAPLRLSVFIEAPCSAIDFVLAKHTKLRELVDNEWLHMFQFDATKRTILARRSGSWMPAP